jgi:hypothetical protein
LRRTQKLDDGSHRVTAPKMLMRDLLKQRTNMLVGLDRRFS